VSLTLQKYYSTILYSSYNSLLSPTILCSFSQFPQFSILSYNSLFDPIIFPSTHTTPFYNSLFAIKISSFSNSCML
jgi:hypothetical protein